MNNYIKKTKILSLNLLLMLTASVSSFAQEVLGVPKDWGLDLQDPASQIAADIKDMHNLVLILMALITLFVAALLVWVMYRYREKKNPTPSKTVHNTLIEILWTAIPVLILTLIAIPSFKLLYKADVVPKVDMTIKAIGHQWYWSYEYPDHGNFTYDAFLVQSKEEMEDDRPFNRMLTTDTRVVLPVNKTIRVLVTAGDVLHSWAVPALGVKSDAVPGRLNETWFKADKIGIFYGQCSELCGVNHQSMPIEIHIVSEEKFNLWVKESKENFAKKNYFNEKLIAKNK